MSKIGKKNDATRAEGLSAGTTKHYPDPKQSLTFGGATYTVAEVQGNLQKIPELRTATATAQATAAERVADEKAQLPALLAFMFAYIAFVRATYGNSPTSLGDFGLPTKKARAPLTSEQMLAAVAKRDSTRKARGVRGSQQKKLIVGNVTGVVVTPVTAPAPAADAAHGASPSPSPAPQPTGQPAAASGSGSGTGNGSASGTQHGS
jgi:hypothetical protein